MVGDLRNSLDRFRDLYRTGWDLPLAEITPTKPDLKNRAAPGVETAVVEMAVGN